MNDQIIAGELVKVALESYAGKENAFTAVRAVYKAVNGKDGGGKATEAAEIAKDYVNRDRKKEAMGREQNIAERVAKDIVSTSPEALVSQIEKLTDRNNHNGAALLLAKALGNRKYIKVLESIDVVSNFAGSLPRDLRDIRYGMLQQMWKDATRKFGPEIGHQIYMAF